jgi:hypothetical protein
VKRHRISVAGSFFIITVHLCCDNGWIHNFVLSWKRIVFLSAAVSLPLRPCAVGKLVSSEEVGALTVPKAPGIRSCTFSTQYSLLANIECTGQLRHAVLADNVGMERIRSTRDLPPSMMAKWDIARAGKDRRQPKNYNDVPAQYSSLARNRRTSN